MAKKEATFKLNVESDSAINDIKQLDKEVNNLGDDFVEVSSDISKMEDRLYDMALAGDTTSQEFKELQAQTAKYKQIVIETDRSIDALAEQGRGLSSALSLAEGTVAGFQAFTGVSALLGTENEELLETITKLQAAQGVLNSIEIIKQQIQNNSIKITQAQTAAQKLLNLAVGNGTKSMKLLRGALLATGIGALVVGIGLLIANWDKLTKSISGSTKAQEYSNDVTAQAIESAAKELSALDKLSNTINDETKTRDEKNAAVEELQAAYPDLLTNMNAEKLTIDELNEAIRLNSELVLINAKLEAVAAIRAEEFKKQMEAQIALQSGVEAGLLDQATAYFTNTNATLNAMSAQGELITQSEEHVSILDDLASGLESERDAIQGVIGVTEDLSDTQAAADEARKQRLAELANQEKEIADARLNWAAQQNELIDLIAQAEEEYQTSAKQKELNAVNDRYFELITRAEEFGIETQTLKIAQLEETAAIETAYDEAELERKRKLEADKLAVEQQARTIRTEIRGTEFENELLKITEEFEAKKLLLQENQVIEAEEKAALALLLKDQELAQIAELEEQYRQKDLEATKAANDQKKQAFSDYAGNVAAGLNSLSSLNDAVTQTQLNNAKGNAEKEEKIRKEGFERSKKIQIALAIVQGIQGVMAAFTAGSSMGPAGVVMGPLMAALAAAGAIANIAKISSTKYQSSSPPASGGGGGYSGVANAGASASSFSVAAIPSSTQTDLNEDGTQTDTSTSPIQVFVTETDISETQNNVEQIEVKSTY